MKYFLMMTIACFSVAAFAQPSEPDDTGKLQKIISPEKLLKLRRAEIDFKKLLLRQIQQRRRSRR